MIVNLNVYTKTFNQKTLRTTKTIILMLQPLCRRCAT